MSNKIMLFFLTLICVFTFSAEKLSAKPQITVDDMGDPLTYSDDGVGNWSTNVVLGGAFSEGSPRAYMRIDLMNSLSSQMMFGFSFCYDESYSEDYNSSSITRQYWSYGSTPYVSTYNGWVGRDEEITLTNNEFLASLRIYLLPVDSGVNFFYQLGLGFSFSEEKTKSYSSGSSPYYPWDFGHWVNNPNPIFMDSEMNSYYGSSPEETDNKIYLVWDFSVGLEFGQSVFVTLGANSWISSGNFYAAAGIKF